MIKLNHNIHLGNMNAKLFTLLSILSTSSVLHQKKEIVINVLKLLF